MRHLRLFEQYEDLGIGANTNLGTIEDKTETQYYINGTWYHYRLVHAEEPAPKKPTKPKSQPARTLVVVDVQPDYKSAFHFSLRKFSNYVSKHDNVVFLYNGANTVGDIDEATYYDWLERIGFSTDFLDDARLLDKGYAFFRCYMDAGASEHDMMMLLRYMLKHGEDDSRDVEPEVLDTLNLDDVDLMKQLGKGEVMYFPPVMKTLAHLPEPIELVGGGRDECLKEVEYCLQLLKKTYRLRDEYVY